MEELRKKLLLAITEGSEGFGMMWILYVVRYDNEFLRLVFFYVKKLENTNQLIKKYFSRKFHFF